MRRGRQRAFVLLLLTAACGGRDATPAAAAPPVVTVTARDFAFEGPTEIPAGVTTFRLVNAGQTLHHMQLVRLDSAKTVTDLVAALKNPGPPPAWALFVTGPNAPSPGGESNATIDLAAGQYAVICLVDIPGGVPHFMKGMVHALTVTPAAAGAPKVAMPVADIQITLADYQFTFSAPITAGKHTFTVHTSAGQPHEIEIIKLAPGKTADDLLKWIVKPEGPPPGSGVGGVAATSPGVVPTFSADFTPGDYLVICFLPDSKDGKPHFMHGMQQVVKVA